MKKSSRGYIMLFIALALSLLVGACSKISQAPSDPQIISNVQAQLYQNAELKTLPVTVTSEHGVVTLAGSVNAPLEKLAVEDIARRTAGVKQVIDQLAVAPAPAAQAEESAPKRSHRHRGRRYASAYAQNDVQQPSPGSADASQQASVPASPPTETPAAQAETGPPPPAANPAPPPPPQAVKVVIPTGTVVTVSMIDPISSETAQAGKEFAASVFAPVVVGNHVVIPQGADARVRLVEVRSAGHYQGQSELKVELVGLTVHGVKYPVESAYYDKVGTSRGKNSAEKIGGGAALGALLGAIIGHGKGAGIGAGVGAAGGTVAQGATHGQKLTIPSEARIDFTLKGPATITLHPRGGAAPQQAAPAAPAPEPAPAPATNNSGSEQAAAF